MILVDTGPLVALFDPKDEDHAITARMLAEVRSPLVTTVPVLTEAFHLLRPASRGASGLREFIDARGLGVWFMDAVGLARVFELGTSTPTDPWTSRMPRSWPPPRPCA